MTLLETAKFAKLRKRLTGDTELEALKSAIEAVAEDPLRGKKLKGEFSELRSFRYSVSGQSRRLIYLWEDDTFVLFSFGPRQGIYR